MRMDDWSWALVSVLAGFLCAGLIELVRTTPRLARRWWGRRRAARRIRALRGILWRAGYDCVGTPWGWHWYDQDGGILALSENGASLFADAARSYASTAWIARTAAGDLRRLPMPPEHWLFCRHMRDVKAGRRPLVRPERNEAAPAWVKEVPVLPFWVPGRMKSPPPNLP